MKMRWLIYICFLALLNASAARACPVADPTCEGIEAEPLFFGQIIITDNSAVRSCTIPAGGTMTCDAQITILNPGQFGVFRLEGYANTAVWFSVDDTSTTMTSTVGPPFTDIFDIKNFTFAPAYVDIGTSQILPGGTLLLKIGATLQTRAGETYDISTYRGTFNLLVNY
jgi:hypothetical protein